MRALAVLAVLLYHAGLPLLSGGFVGVDMFFVLSGFLITGNMIREVQRTGKLRIGRFYARRILRLIPAATVVILAVTAATALWVPMTQWRSIAKEAVGSAFYFVNWQLAATTNYLNAEQLPSPLQHFWSLAVEEQFYIVWPILFCIVAAASLGIHNRSGASFSKMNRARWTMPVVLLLVVVSSLAFSVIALDAWPSASYFILPARLWELGVGALVAFAAPALGTMKPIAGKVTSLAGAGLVLYAALTYSSSTPFPVKSRGVV